MTIKDLAALSGYAVGTVSLVLNNQPNVSEKARKAILDVVNAQGFQLNENASEILTGILRFFILGCEFFINYRLEFRSRKHTEEVAKA